MVSYPLTTAQERATLRAVTQRIQPVPLGNGGWVTESATTPGMYYTTTIDSCDCPAGQAGKPCKHIAAVLLAAEQHECRHCGHIGADVEEDREYHGFYCINRAECWQRWDAQHGLEA